MSISINLSISNFIAKYCFPEIHIFLRGKMLFQKNKYDQSDIPVLTFYYQKGGRISIALSLFMKLLTVSSRSGVICGRIHVFITKSEQEVCIEILHLPGEWTEEHRLVSVRSCRLMG